MRFSIILPLCLVVLYSTFTNATFFPHNRIGAVITDIGSFKCHDFGCKRGFIASILDLVRRKIALKCEVARNLFYIHGCIVNGILIREKLMRLLAPLRLCMRNMPMAKWLSRSSYNYNPVYDEVCTQCVAPRYLEAACPGLEFIYCFMRSVHYNCEPSVRDPYCIAVHGCAYEYRHGVAYK